MSRAKHARRTPNAALAVAGLVVLAVMALITPTVMATPDGAGDVPPAQSERTPVALPGLGGRSSTATAVNGHGQIAGYAEDPDGNSRAVVWDEHGGKPRVLDNLPSGTWAEAHDINDHGQVVGRAQVPSSEPYRVYYRAVLWEPDGTVRDLGTLDGPRSLATGINDDGQVVGASNYLPNPSDQNIHPFLWEQGEMQDLNGPGFDGDGIARDINDRGEIVGNMGNLAFRITDGEIITLSQQPASDARTINDNGQAAGTHALLASPTLWEADGTAIALPSLDGKDSSVAAINDGETMAGFDPTHDESGILRFRALLWEDRQLVRLPALPDAPDAVANGINDDGTVVGHSGNMDTAETEAIVWK